MTIYGVMPAYKNPVFIVGMPRLGTTLIQGILCDTGECIPIPAHL